jgi:flagellar hook-associated protein 3 FlgL
MRVTQNMMSSSMIVHLQRQNEKLFEIQQQIATQKRINKPSDDPGGLNRVLEYRTMQAVMEQYQRNIEQGRAVVETNELTLGLIDELMGMAREIAQTYGGSDTSPEERQMAACQVNDLYDQIVDLINSKTGSDYLFSGHKTDTPPYAHVVEISGSVPVTIDFGLTAVATGVTIDIRDDTGTVVRTLTPAGPWVDGDNSTSWDGNDDFGAAVGDGQYTFTITATDAIGDPILDYYTYNGDDGQLPIIIGENTEVYLDMDARNYLAPSTGVDVIEVLRDMVAGLENPDPDAGSVQVATAIEKLDEGFVQLNAKRTEYAPKLSRLELAENHWNRLSANIEVTMGKIEGTDTTEAAVLLNSLQLAYETTLATAARLVQPGLLNFLK